MHAPHELADDERPLFRLERVSSWHNQMAWPKKMRFCSPDIILELSLYVYMYQVDTYIEKVFIQSKISHNFRICFHYYLSMLSPLELEAVLLHFFMLFRVLCETWVFMYLYTAAQSQNVKFNASISFVIFFCRIWTGLADNDSCNFVLKQFSEWKQYGCSIGKVAAVVYINDIN